MKYLVFFLFSFSFIYSQNISIQISKELEVNSISNFAIQDFRNLLKIATKDSIYLNSKLAKIQIVLPQKLENEKVVIMDSVVKLEDFEWLISEENNIKKWKLEAKSPKAIANGLYALLQEKLGFAFYHPKNTLIPNLQNFDFQLKSFKGNKVFDKIGFHLHTMHPTELTEYLLDEKQENAFEFIKEYIDWLARNGQNYFEFNLLESINRKNWIVHAQKITSYSHQRGIFSGVDISMHMLQQKAFQLYKNFPASWNSQSKQLEKNANWLLQAGFDLWNVELSATEFTAGNAEKKSKLLQELQAIVKSQNVKIMSRTHVVKHAEMLGKAKSETKLPQEHGLMIHTVMFYSLLDSIAPVYRNKNLNHMLDLLLKVKNERETWYYPETAYWVTFDNSVPMLLLPYLEARLNDINLCDSLKINGHLTFSSGWEWGYWLLDWSIARWSWNFIENNEIKTKKPLQYILNLCQSDSFKNYLKYESKLQQEYIKDKELIRILDAQTITDEIKGKINLEFHPRPKYSYKFIRNQASLKQLDTILEIYQNPLKEFIIKSQENQSQINKIELNEIEKEIYESLQITNLRANHRFNTLNYLIEFRLCKITKDKCNENYIDEAKKFRKEGLEIVKIREANYRYSLEKIALKRKDHTAYHFGYLYPVHNLHFWEREEGQALKNKYKIFYKNIWNIPRIIGIIN